MRWSLGHELCSMINRTLAQTWGTPFFIYNPRSPSIIIGARCKGRETWHIRSHMSHIELEFLTCSNCQHRWCYRCAYHDYFLQSEQPPYQAIKSCKYCSTSFTTDQVDYFLRALNWGIRHSYWDWCPADIARTYLSSIATTATNPSATPAYWKPT